MTRAEIIIAAVLVAVQLICGALIIGVVAQSQVTANAPTLATIVATLQDQVNAQDAKIARLEKLLKLQELINTRVLSFAQEAMARILNHELRLKTLEKSRPSLEKNERKRGSWIIPFEEEYE